MWMQISSGRGPEECCLAVANYADYLTHKHHKQGLELRVLDTVPGSHKGTYRSILLSVTGLDGTFQEEHHDGTLLWICKSPYRPKHERKNWFFNCEVFQEPKASDIDISKVRVETMRSSGNGGQNVNKVESAVRVTHLPSGLTVTAREERTQALNKKLALARLFKMLQAQEQDQESTFKTELWTQHNRLVRGNPVQVFEGNEFRLRKASERMNK